MLDITWERRMSGKVLKRKFMTMPGNWIWFLGQIIIFYVLIVIAAFFFQDFLLYPAASITPEQAKDRYARLGFAPWPDDVPGHRGYLSESLIEPVLGTVIVFHGNAGTALDRAYYPRALNRLGYRVILAEYPGYGSRSGSFGEQSFVDDAAVVLDEAKGRFGSPVFLIGESLGAGVAAALAARMPDSVDGIALITPWDSLPDLAQRKFWFLPAGLIVKSEFDNIANLASYGGPKAVLIAAEDSIIPPRHAMRLYQALGQPRRLWTFEGAGHNSWPASADEKWWAELVDYLALHGK